MRFWPSENRVPQDDKHSGPHAWTDMDRWNMHTALASLIADGIREFRREQHGFPFRLDPRRISSSEEWDGILESIEVGFQAFVDCDGDPDMDVTGTDRYKFNMALDLFTEYFEDFWD